MKKILVPCDFSKPAIHAYRFALDIALRSHGTVHLLNVIELPVMHDSVLMPVLDFETELFKELKEKSEIGFDKLKAIHHEEKIAVHTNVVFGSPIAEINDYIVKNEIDLVVMGSHGATGMREVFVGSNAEKVVRKSPVPVLVVKNYYKGPVKNIVFPNNLDIEHQEELVLKVKALQDFFKAHLHLVWINTPANFQPDTITRDRLQKFADRFMLTHYTTTIFNDINEESGILHFTKLVDGDMIAMGTNGRTGINHLVNGSYTEGVVNHGENLIWTQRMNIEQHSPNDAFRITALEY